MRRKILAASLAGLAFAAAASAGVLFQIETEDFTKSPADRRTIHVTAEGTNLRLDITKADRTDENMVIFRGSVPEVHLVDHRRKSYLVIDGKMVDSLVSVLSPMLEPTAEVSEAEGEPETGAPAHDGAESETPPAESKTDLRKTDVTEIVHGFPTVRYDAYEGDRKVRELWISEWKQIEGGDEALIGFESLADFGRKLIDSFSRMGGGGGMTSQFDFFTQIRDLDGFPVRSRELAEDGSILNEARLIRSRRADLDGRAFETPQGYTRQPMFSGR